MKRVLGTMVVLGGIVAGLSGCPQQGAQAPQTPQPVQQGAPQGAQPGMPNGMQLPPKEEVRSIYPDKLTGPPPAEVVALCEALHKVPESRRAACCQGTPGINLYEDCVRTVSHSVGQKAIRLFTDEVKNCATQFAQSLEKCDWVGGFPPTLPIGCTTLLHGMLPQGAPCRSSLECQSSMRCRGVGPTQLGVCGPPLEIGDRCGQAVDPLAAYTKQTHLEYTHPECPGYCTKEHRCAPPLPKGAPCVFSAQCGPAQRCGKSTCIVGALGQLGEACTGNDCIPSLRCHGGKCIKPGASGASCQSDFECMGGCNEEAAKGTPEGSKPHKVCGPKCSLR